MRLKKKKSFGNRRSIVVSARTHALISALARSADVTIPKLIDMAMREFAYSRLTGKGVNDEEE